MADPRIEKYRKQLLELRTDVRANLEDVSEQARQPTGGQADGGLSNAPMHLGDLGTDTYLQELSSTVMETEQDLVDEISAALERIDDGTFGTCEECGQPIAEARLAVLPYTRYCVKCAETADSSPRANLNVGRPQRPQDTLADKTAQGIEPGDQPEVAREHSPSPLADTAADTAGGGTALGGLAGTNSGGGDPDDVDLHAATSRGHFTPESEEGKTRYSGRSGGAVGGAAGDRTP